MNPPSRIALLASAFAAAVVPPAFAQQAAPADIGACMQVENDRDRLACYDAATHRQIDALFPPPRRKQPLAVG